MRFLVIIALEVHCGMSEIQQTECAEPNTIAYTTACGPIAVYVALSNCGVTTSLQTVISQCEWSEGELTALSKLARVLDTYSEVAVAARQVSPRELVRFVQGDGAAIIPIRKGSEAANHVVCVVAAGSNMVEIIDYPELRGKLTLEQLAQNWDGEALLVRRSIAQTCLRLVPVFLLPGLAVTLVARQLATSLGRSQCVRCSILMLLAAGIVAPGCDVENSHRGGAMSHPVDAKETVTAQQSPRDAMLCVSHRHLGRIIPGETVEAEFPIFNPSSNPVHLVGSAASCGCLTILDAPDEIAPLSTGAIRLSLSASGAPAGMLRQSAMVKTDSAACDVLRFDVSAAVHGIYCTPSHLDLGMVCAGGSSARTLGLNFVDPIPDDLDVSAVDKELLVAAFKGDALIRRIGTAEPHRFEEFVLRKVEVAVSRNVTVGKFSSTLTIHSQTANLAISIPVFGEVVGRVRCIPSTVTFSGMASGAPDEERIVAVEQVATEQVDLRDLSFENNGLDVSIRVVESNAEAARIAVSLKPVSDARSVRRFRVVGTIDGEPVLSLPVLSLPSHDRH